MNIVFHDSETKQKLITVKGLGFLPRNVIGKLYTIQGIPFKVVSYEPDNYEEVMHVEVIPVSIEDSKELGSKILSESENFSLIDKSFQKILDKDSPLLELYELAGI